MKTLLLAAALVSAAPRPHEFFISILTIHHDPAKQQLELTWRMTAHDIEHALEPQGRLQLGSPHELPQADSLIQLYLGEHLHLSLQGNDLHWRWLGKELDSEDLYCYLEVDSISDVDGLTVSNSLLQDVFAEQQNVVHLETTQGTLTHDFMRGASPFMFQSQ